MEWIDTHAHLVREEPGESADVLLDRASAAGVVHVVSIGTTYRDSVGCIELADRDPRVCATVGLHPNNLADVADADFQQIARLAEHPRVVGIGETGLDRYWKIVPIEKQRTYFDLHLQLSRRVGKPVIIHCRDADADVLDMLRAEVDRVGEPILGVMHSFAGSIETARECLSLGLAISFAGMVTFKKNDALREVARHIPADRLLVETDTPYLSPEPYRGKPNEPSRVIHTGACLAAVCGVAEEDLARQTTATARRVFRLSGQPTSAHGNG